jgi:tetratricopeptide (TPR) repeat protein
MLLVKRAKQLVDQSWSSNDLRNLDTARDILQDAIAANPADTTLLICLGAVLSDRGEHAQAVKILEKAIMLGSVDRNAYKNLAIALMNCDSDGHHRAIGFFKQASEMAPSSDTWEAYFDPQAH